VLEDLHWAEPTLLDLLEQVVERTEGVPLLVLATARPDLLERRPQWADAHVTARLEPLGDADAATLIEKLAEDELDADVRARIAEAAEGNPLFAEQLLAFVLEQGPSALDTLPPTIEALLASRLDTLGREERAIVERASIVGRDFRQSELVALSQPEEAGMIGSALNVLVGRGFVRRRRATAAAEDAFAFSHVLIRDVTYAAVPKERRAELHEAFADWLSSRPDGRDEIVGYHLEQAHGFLLQLAPPTRRVRQLALEASERLGSAGMRAFKHGDMPAATNLLNRAAPLLPESDERRLELLIELGVASSLAGDTAHAESVLGEALRLAGDAHDRRLEARSEIELANLHLLLRGETDRLVETASAAIDIFEAVGDERSLARAWLLLGWVQGGFFCQNAAWEAAVERALEHYRNSGWPTTRCVGDLAAALFYGPRPVELALTRLAELREEDAGRGGEANCLLWMGALESLRGDFDVARDLAGRATTIYDELGFAVAAATSSGVAGMIELLRGDLEAAESLYRNSCENLDRLDQSAYLATFASGLAEALYEQGAYTEAERWAQKAREHSGPRDLSAEFSWRSILARAVAQRGAVEEAELLALEARDLVEGTDALNQRGNVLLSLAEVLRLAGRTRDAAAVVDAALAAFTTKGNTVSSARATALKSELVLV
jgi:tetratricopeptide (TPR) repeat protein